MSNLTDPIHLLSRQYRTGANLQTRMELHRRFSTNSENWFRWVFDRMEIPAGARVLELGSGTGKLWRENLDRLPADWEITLSDLSQGMLDEARRNMGQSGDRFEWRIIDAQSIPFADDSLDTVIANHMLYHVPDRPKALAEICRVLRPGGRLYAATNGITHVQEILELMDRFVPDAGGPAGPPQERAEEEFGLESGAEQLSRVFSEVRIYRHPNALMVTETEPLVAYILSSTFRVDLNDEEISVLYAWVRDELAQRGVIRITTDAGLLSAC